MDSLHYDRGQRRGRKLSILAIACVFVGSLTANGATPTSKVRFYTTMGTVEIEMYGTQSPLGVANFLSYVDDGSYNDSIIHRTRDGSTVAGSDLFAQGGSYKTNGAGITAKAPVVNEFNVANGLSNVAYTLAAARSSSPNSATSGWFINQTNNATAFDAGPYTVLGKVTSGKSIIDQIPFLNNLPILQGSGLDSMPIYNNAEVTITKAIRIPILPGDFDFSGTVTAADYAVWKSNFGSKTNLAADANGDGTVNSADYAIWQSALPHGSGSGSANLLDSSVPEPASAMIILLGALPLGFLRSRR